MDIDDVNRLVGEMTRGVSTRYDVGSAHVGAGRLIGDRALRSGDDIVSLHDLRQDGSGVLLDASRDGQAARLVQAATTRVRCVAVEDNPSLLIGPDACVAWVGRDGREDRLEAAIQRWVRPH